MQNQIKNLKDINLYSIKIGLICSILALDSFLPSFQETNLRVVDSFTEELIYTEQYSSNFLQWLNKIRSNDIFQDLLMPFVPILKLMILNDSCLSKDQYVVKERLKQYLRKFLFFYRSLYTTHYPNDTSLVSVTKVNTLAIQSLFILYGL